MDRGTVSFSLLAVFLGAPFLHAQMVAHPAYGSANPTQQIYSGTRRQIQQSLPSQRSYSIPQSRTAADNDTGNPINFAGFYTAPLISGVAPVSAGSTRIAFLTTDVNHDGHPDLLSIDSNGGIAAAINDGTGHFAAPVITAPTPATTNTVDAMASDVNGDGYPDVVVLTGGVPANNGPGPDQFIVLINQKDGTFKATATLTPTNGPSLYWGWNPFNPPLAWTVGATRGTGLPDIVAEYPVIGTGGAAKFARTVFLNDGSGGFSDATQSFTTVPLQTSYYSPTGFLTTPHLLLGDVNHDGKPDLLTTYVLPLPGPFQVDIALGNGDGTFAAPLSNTAISMPNDLVVQNVSHLALANLSGSTSSAPDLLLSRDNSIFLAAANGDGTFKAPVLITEDSYKDSASIAGFQVTDVNGDGLSDLLVLRYGALAVLPGKGNGSFGAAVNTVVTNTGDTYEPGLAIADFDGDGKLDFIADSIGSADVAFGKGSGDGNFAATSFVDATSASVPSGNFAVMTALDLNGDGKTDLLGLDTINGNIFAAFATSGGSFTFKPTLSQISLSSGISILDYTADFNGDGKSDLIMEQYIAEPPPTYATVKIGVALSNGDGSFQNPVFITIPATISANFPNGITEGDVNGDGKMDLVMVYQSQGPNGSIPGGYCVALGKGDGTFNSAVFTQFGATPTDVLLDRFHGSKAPIDMVIGDTGERTSATPQVSMLKGNGDGTFGTATTIVSGQVTSGLLSGDFNKDGNPDLIVPINYAYGPPPSYTVNFDQDGLALYLGHGDGSFSPVTTVAAGSNPNYPLTADVNGDGNLDILYGGFRFGTDDGLTVLLGHGDGTFSGAIRYPLPVGTYLAAGNFLGDNAQSLVAGVPGVGAALLVNQGGTSIALTSDGSTISAKVTATLDSRPVPTGNGTFLDDTTVLGTSALSNGVASLTTSGLTAGSHTITFQYSGDANFQPNTASGAISVTASAPDFMMSSSENSLSITQGQSATLKLTITANAGLSGAVSFACTGLPSGSACSFSPVSLTAIPGQSSTTTLSITTTAPSSAMTRQPAWMMTQAITALGFLIAIPFYRGSRRRLWILIGVAVLGASSLAGCGGTSSAQNQPSNNGTPAGSYSVSVTATSANVTHTLPITVVIQ